ncbi:FAD-dependent monooxygenase [Phycicoccus sp. CSK15P-2]|uniref:FAD-dependent oxidoreductase n=1 Tax=Phycicoccus sp. CSK15P-2 TaxID=2807627 RepID=UPI00194E48D2|nr:NAD(P)/FAD-dependent oxidoreductase [Phycicoccus sp. CSK15P-2]MBM6404289.1 FAD-dependent monooxygenase [Phycicoccus sp. CSK15P-2]
MAVTGLGTAGAAVAALLHDLGHDVTVLEQAPDPGPVGAGLWLQGMGQTVLDRLGLLDALRAVSTPVDRVDVRTAAGRQLVAVGYDDLPGAVPALGVHRGDLFGLLQGAVGARGIPVETGVRVTGVAPAAGGLVVGTGVGHRGPFDLVVGADGSRSVVREALGVTRRDHPYGYGALWAVVDDPHGLAGGTLHQRLRGTRQYLGVLPTGSGRASVFWSVHQDRMGATLAAGLDAWRAEAEPFASGLEPLLERVGRLLPAVYRDVVVRRPSRMSGDGAAVVLVGDAAHAMSPQLGTGASLALADAWTLALCVGEAGRGRARLGEALETYAASRRRHLRWYQWWTRLMMPVFQSDLVPLAGVRDLAAPVVCGLPGVPRLLVGTLCGDRTSPWSRWTPPYTGRGASAPSPRSSAG